MHMHAGNTARHCVFCLDCGRDRSHHRCTSRSRCVRTCVRRLRLPGRVLSPVMEGDANSVVFPTRLPEALVPKDGVRDRQQLQLLSSRLTTVSRVRIASPRPHHPNRQPPDHSGSGLRVLHDCRGVEVTNLLLLKGILWQQPSAIKRPVNGAICLQIAPEAAPLDGSPRRVNLASAL